MLDNEVKWCEYVFGKYSMMMLGPQLLAFSVNVAGVLYLAVLTFAKILALPSQFFFTICYTREHFVCHIKQSMFSFFLFLLVNRCLDI